MNSHRSHFCRVKLLLCPYLHMIASLRHPFLVVGPPTSCRDVQTRKGIFSDGEYSLLSKNNKFVQVRLTLFIESPYFSM